MQIYIHLVYQITQFWIPLPELTSYANSVILVLLFSTLLKIEMGKPLIYYHVLIILLLSLFPETSGLLAAMIKVNYK